ncbi:MAG: DUF5610 domain-containing protein [Comamonadaceae bacterium]|nr:DUF5610 domain-containing protein [Comamonadaceae bacterium]
MGGVQKSGQGGSQRQSNLAIAEASVQVSIRARNEPMQLLYTSVLDKLNALLNPQSGESALQDAVSRDNSPESTASRVVGLSAGLFEAYKTRNAGENEAELVNRFVEIIRSGIEQGFKEARDILQGLGVLQGDVASILDQAYALVQQKLDVFQSRLLASTEAAQPVEG